VESDERTEFLSDIRLNSNNPEFNMFFESSDGAEGMPGRLDVSAGSAATPSTASSR